MRHRKENPKLRKTKLAALLKKIDKASEAYTHGDGMDFYPYGQYNEHMRALLKELDKYRPLNIRTRKHGYRMYCKLLPKRGSSLDELMIDIWDAFDLPYGRSPFRWYRQWWNRNVVSLYEEIVNKIEVIYAMFLER